jgi:acyl carrier protein
MVPSLLVQLEAMPLTPNGKINRKALPQPNVEQMLSRQYVPPRNVTEEKLVAIWEGLLGAKRIGVRDNFFELGGNSLLVIRVIAAIRENFSLDIPVNTLFKFACIAELAEYIDAVTVDEEDGDFEEFEL